MLGAHPPLVKELLFCGVLETSKLFKADLLKPVAALYSYDAPH